MDILDNLQCIYVNIKIYVFMYLLEFEWIKLLNCVQFYVVYSTFNSLRNVCDILIDKMFLKDFFICHSVLDKNVLSPPKNPRPFFPVGSAVLDHPWGDLMPVADLLVTEELLVVMYYAPWCHDSVQAKTEYMKAAKVLENRVRNN